MFFFVFFGGFKSCRDVHIYVAKKLEYYTEKKNNYYYSLFCSFEVCHNSLSSQSAASGLPSKNALRDPID